MAFIGMALMTIPSDRFQIGGGDLWCRDAPLRMRFIFW